MLFLAQEFLDRGADTICTNFIIPEELPDGGSFFGKKGRGETEWQRDTQELIGRTAPVR